MKISDIDGLAKSQRSPRRHAKLDPESIDDRYFYIPACAGMTIISLSVIMSQLTFIKILLKFCHDDITHLNYSCTVVFPVVVFMYLN